MPTSCSIQLPNATPYHSTLIFNEIQTTPPSIIKSNPFYDLAVCGSRLLLIVAIIHFIALSSLEKTLIPSTLLISSNSLASLTILSEVLAESPP